MGFEPREIASINNLRHFGNAQTSRNTQNRPSWNDPGTVNLGAVSAAEQSQKHAWAHDSNAFVLSERQQARGPFSMVAAGRLGRAARNSRNACPAHRINAIDDFGLPPLLLFTPGWDFRRTCGKATHWSSGQRRSSKDGEERLTRVILALPRRHWIGAAPRPVHLGPMKLVRRQ